VDLLRRLCLVALVPLNGKQRRKLRALGHHLEPVVIVGQNGVTPGVIAAVDQALFDHELIKVKLPEGREERLDQAEMLAQQTESEVAQVLGRTLLLYRRHPEKSKIGV
jgi:RNA-binding protein